MRTLLTIVDLRGWTQETIADDDVLAQNVIMGASFKVADTAGHLEWLDEAFIDEVPYRATLIANLLAKRSYLNPNSIIAEGGIGPIGGDRYVEEFARFLTLTESEIDELEDLRPADGASVGGLYIVQTEVRPISRGDDTVYVADSPYVGSDAFPLGSTADAAAYGI